MMLSISDLMVLAILVVLGLLAYGFKGKLVDK
jgi:hypothetical protein